ncbi:hypothetical protein DFH27DRAFT_627286 [Peziza echinospora]|nr:hypothetical protein DFH27DRAFT_627286 [Peziza echinospora]
MHIEVTGIEPKDLQVILATVQQAKLKVHEQVQTQNPMRRGAKVHNSAGDPAQGGPSNQPNGPASRGRSSGQFSRRAMNPEFGAMVAGGVSRGSSNYSTIAAPVSVPMPNPPVEYTGHPQSVQKLFEHQQMELYNQQQRFIKQIQEQQQSQNPAARHIPENATPAQASLIMTPFQAIPTPQGVTPAAPPDTIPPAMIPKPKGEPSKEEIITILGISQGLWKRMLSSSVDAIATHGLKVITEDGSPAAWSGLPPQNIANAKADLMSHPEYHAILRRAPWVVHWLLKHSVYNWQKHQSRLVKGSAGTSQTHQGVSQTSRVSQQGSHEPQQRHTPQPVYQQSVPQQQIHQPAVQQSHQNLPASRQSVSRTPNPQLLQHPQPQYPQSNYHHPIQQFNDSEQQQPLQPYMPRVNQPQHQQQPQGQQSPAQHQHPPQVHQHQNQQRVPPRNNNNGRFVSRSAGASDGFSSSPPIELSTNTRIRLRQTHRGRASDGGSTSSQLDSRVEEEMAQRFGLTIQQLESLIQEYKAAQPVVAGNEEDTMEHAPHNGYFQEQDQEVPPALADNRHLLQSRNNLRNAPANQHDGLGTSTVIDLSLANDDYQSSRQFMKQPVSNSNRDLHFQQNAWSNDGNTRKRGQQNDSPEPVLHQSGIGNTTKRTRYGHDGEFIGNSGPAPRPHARSLPQQHIHPQVQPLHQSGPPPLQPSPAPPVARQPTRHGNAIHQQTYTHSPGSAFNIIDRPISVAGDNRYRAWLPNGLDFIFFESHGYQRFLQLVLEYLLPEDTPAERNAKREENGLLYSLVREFPREEWEINTARQFTTMCRRATVMKVIYVRMDTSNDNAENRDEELLPLTYNDQYYHGSAQESDQYRGVGDEPHGRSSGGDSNNRFSLSPSGDELNSRNRGGYTKRHNSNNSNPAPSGQYRTDSYTDNSPDYGPSSLSIQYNNHNPALSNFRSRTRSLEQMPIVEWPATPSPPPSGQGPPRHLFNTSSPQPPKGPEKGGPTPPLTIQAAMQLLPQSQTISQKKALITPAPATPSSPLTTTTNTPPVQKLQTPPVEIPRTPVRAAQSPEFPTPKPLAEKVVKRGRGRPRKDANKGKYPEIIQVAQTSPLKSVAKTVGQKRNAKSVGTVEELGENQQSEIEDSQESPPNPNVRHISTRSKAIGKRTDDTHTTRVTRGQGVREAAPLIEHDEGGPQQPMERARPGRKAAATTTKQRIRRQRPSNSDANNNLQKNQPTVHQAPATFAKLPMPDKVTPATTNNPVTSPPLYSNKEANNRGIARRRGRPPAGNGVRMGQLPLASSSASADMSSLPRFVHAKPLIPENYVPNESELAHIMRDELEEDDFEVEDGAIYRLWYPERSKSPKETNNIQAPKGKQRVEVQPPQAESLAPPEQQEQQAQEETIRQSSDTAEGSEMATARAQRREALAAKRKREMLKKQIKRRIFRESMSEVIETNRERNKEKLRQIAASDIIEIS